MQYSVTDEDAKRMGRTAQIIISIAAGLLVVIGLLGWEAYRLLTSYLG